MKKSLLIIMTVAILGGLGLYINKPTGNPAVTTNSSNTAATTPVTTPTTTDSSSTSTTTGPTAAYKDGTYTGSASQTPYGTVQVAAVINGGKITDVNFLQMPNDLGNSREIASYAEPLLKETAIQKQSSRIDFVSGATSDSMGFQESLQAALDQAAS